MAPDAAHPFDDAELPDALADAAPADLTCPGSLGEQKGAAWPVFGRCSGRPHSTPAIGPARAPSVRWTHSVGTIVVGAEPVISADGTLYVLTSDNGLVALGPDGSLRWAAPDVHVSLGTYGGSLAIGRGGTIYAQGDRLYTVRPDGALVGSRSVGASGSPVAWSPMAIGSSGVLYEIQSVLEGSAMGSTLYAVGADGSVAWSLRVNDGTPAIVPPALGSDDTVYLYAPASMGVLAVFGGHVRWTTTAANFAMPIVGYDGLVYVTSDDSITAFLPSTGASIWTTSLGRGAWVPAIDVDGTFRLLGAGLLRSLHRDGSTAWQATPGVAIGAPLVDGAGNTYFVRSGVADGTLMAYTSGGTLSWQLEGVLGSLAMGADGTLYVLGEGQLVARR